jgi:hypothetical protein
MLSDPRKIAPEPLNPPVRRSPGGFRLRNASAISDSDHEQSQVFQVRLMKARDKAFHTQSKLISYFPQINPLLLVVYSQQLQEILMYLLLAFKKTTTSQDFQLKVTFLKISPATP